jgi:glycosyltransferase involved in cell wall biosynthesis
MSSHLPIVSIAMPFYNCEDTLAAALNSVVRQTYEDWELLLCDDGSADGGARVAESLQDDRIVLRKNRRRRGLAVCLNECIDRARGEYIARMDADDMAYPDRLSKQVRFLEEQPKIDLVGCSMLIFGEDGVALGKRVLPCDHDRIVAHPGLSFGIGHPTWLGRTSWFRRYRYSPEAVRCEDAELLYRSYRESRFANIPEILYGYREPRRGLGKRLRTRIGRVRFLRKAGHPGARQAALVEPVKTLLDAAIVAAGLRYAVLRRREQSLTRPENDRWQEVSSSMMRTNWRKP